MKTWNRHLAPIPTLAGKIWLALRLILDGLEDAADQYLEDVEDACAY